MSKHPVSLLSETKGMNGYEFKNWLGKRSDNDLEKLTSLSNSLQVFIEEEWNNRGEKNDMPEM